MAHQIYISLNLRNCALSNLVEAHNAKIAKVKKKTKKLEESIKRGRGKNENLSYK